MATTSKPEPVSLDHISVYCPQPMLDQLQARYAKRTIPHYVLHDKILNTYQILDRNEYRNKQKCLGYDASRYEIVAFVGEPTN